MPLLVNYYGDNIPYYIGELYRYSGGNEFRLIGINQQRQCFIFDKDHWCTDLVFKELTRVKTGIPVYKSTVRQLSLFNNE